MEVHELKEVIDDKFTSLKAGLDLAFKAIDVKSSITDLAIEKLDKKVTQHEHWLWFFRGALAIIAFILGVIGIKVRF